MTRQDHILKWAVYALALLPLWIAQVYVFSRYPLWGVTPLLFPLSAVAVGNLEKPMSAGIYGLWVGVFWYTLTGCSAANILLMCLAGLFSALATQGGLQPRFSGYFLLCLPTAAVFCLVEPLPLLFFRTAPAAGVLSLAGRQMLITLLFALPVYPLTCLAFRKVGRDKLA